MTRTVNAIRARVLVWAQVCHVPVVHRTQRDMVLTNSHWRLRGDRAYVLAGT